MGKVLKLVILLTLPLIGTASLMKGTAMASQGSSFMEVQDVLQDRKVPVQLSAEEEAELQVYRNGDLPAYEPILDAGLAGDAKRTLAEDSDYYPRIEKRVHGNGICFTGLWTATNPTSPYSGYFAPGKQGLFIGRASVATGKTLAGQSRVFGFAGKIFPTMDPNESVKTANFFTMDYLLGSKIAHFTDAVFSNSPALYGRVLDIDFDFVRSGLKVSKVFKKANKRPGFRPVTQIAAIGENGQIRSPKIIRVVASDGTPRIDTDDFRRELSASNYPGGLKLRVYDGDSDADAQELAVIDLKRSFVSYGCDKQLHFPHPLVK